MIAPAAPFDAAAIMLATNLLVDTSCIKIVILTKSEQESDNRRIYVIHPYTLKIQ